MSKRKFDLDSTLLQEGSRKKQSVDPYSKKHTLDSDEEDEHPEKEEELNADDIEGEEEGVARQDEGVRMTAFNMTEEMEEGHFDKQGHFIWSNEKEIRDNWLDNIDWQRIKDPNAQYQLGEGGLGDESDSEPEEKFDEIKSYKEMLKYMKPGETVNKTINRLGGKDKKLSSVERLKRKKEGTLNDNQDVTKITELANNILTNMGNMDVYQETYEDIIKKIDKTEKKSSMETELDMYADDFDTKEKEKIIETDTNEEKMDLMWEYKWNQTSDEIHGPYNSSQMNDWSQGGYFQKGVWVRKCGEDSNFYSSSRIDFELYL